MTDVTHQLRSAYRQLAKLGIKNPYDAATAIQNMAEHRDDLGIEKVSVRKLYLHGCFGIHSHLLLEGKIGAKSDPRNWCLFYFYDPIVQHLNRVAREFATRGSDANTGEQSCIDDNGQ